MLHKQLFCARGRKRYAVATMLAFGVAPFYPAAAMDCGAAIGAKFGEAAQLCDAPAAAARVVHTVAASADTLPQVMSPASVVMPIRPLRISAPSVPPKTTSRSGLPALIRSVAHRYRIDPRLLAAMVGAESAGKLTAVSHKGALGLMQVMPDTARSMGVTDPSALLNDPQLALETGAAYLKHLQARLGNDVPLVVAAYNAGPGAVRKAGMRVPAYRETQGYVAKVMTTYTAARIASR